MNKQIFILAGKMLSMCILLREKICFLMNKKFQTGDRIEGIAANSNGYVTLKVYEKEPAHDAHAPTPKKKRGPKANPAATASTSKGKSLVSN